MPIILSMLFGGFGWIKSFIAKHWKIVLAVVAAAALFFLHQHYVHAYGEAQFKLGVDTTIAKMKTEVSKRNDVNRAIEQRLDTGINTFADTKAKQDDKRHDAEKKSQDKITTSVDSVPMWKSQECSITPQVLADRNAIRALGPKPLPTPAPVAGETK